jgi:hypothetical protein
VLIAKISIAALVLLTFPFPTQSMANVDSTPIASPFAGHPLCNDQLKEPEITVSLRSTEPVDSTVAEEISNVMSGRVREVTRGSCRVVVSETGQVIVELSPSEYVWLDDSNQPSPLELASLLSQIGLVEIIDLQKRDVEPGTVVATTISAPISGTRIGGAPVFETLASNPNVRQTDASRDLFGNNLLAIQFDGPTGTRIEEYSQRHVGDSVGIVIDHEIFKTVQIASPVGNDLVVSGLSAQELNELSAYLSTPPLPVALTITEVTKKVG